MTMKSNVKILIARYLLWAAVLALMIVIFLFSAKTAEQSSNTSGSFAEKVLTLVVPGFSDFSEVQQKQAVDSIQFIVRKGAHFAVYFALGTLCLFAMNTYDVTAKQKVVTALSISFVYAVSDEIHQLFVPGRAGQIRDVLIDFAGAVTGVALATLIIFVCRKILQKRGMLLEKKYAREKNG